MQRMQRVVEGSPWSHEVSARDAQLAAWHCCWHVGPVKPLWQPVHSRATPVSLLHLTVTQLSTAWHCDAHDFPK